MKEKLKTLLNEKRYLHSIGVCETAVRLAEIYGADKEKAYVAGLLHDCAKNLSYEDAVQKCALLGVELDEVERSCPSLIHAPLGAKIAQTEFGVTDSEITSAIRCHTVGKAHMSLLDKIVYIADMIEPSRDFADVDMLRYLAETNLDKALLWTLDFTVTKMVKKGLLLHPNTVYARNQLIKNTL
ncbi:MAG: bis(5'-nucleosyl)-tetraphosphatase (symmetrical) YqeK [Clostridia bacterium]|nr:bis(5'-nucleosyl)-tetraphosphatase (symmetrical) YqeK [Clostridia bacterium]